MYLQALEARSETDALKEEFRGLSEQIHVKEVDYKGQAEQKGAAVEISSPIKEIITEKLKKEPYAILLNNNGSEMSWSPSGNPPLCPVLPSSGGGARLVAIGNQLYKSGGYEGMQNCYVATLGQKNWSSIPNLNVSGLK